MFTVAHKVPFGDLCKLCERIANKCDKAEKSRLLSDYIAYWRSFHAKLHSDGGPHDSFFSAMRLLLPHLDRDRPAYGIKEATLARLYIDVLAISKDSPDAQKLLHYKTPQVAQAGDFASVAYLVLRQRCPSRGTLSLADVNRLLDDVSAAHAIGGDQGSRQKRDALCDLLKQTSAFEQKWLVRMLLREMRIGLSEKGVLNCYHPDARDLLDVTSSLERVCRELKDPKVRLHEAQVSLFNPVRPMLAERAKPKSVERQLDKQPFFAETKFDGERMQVHKDGSQYRFFTRGSHDYSANFGASSDQGSLSQFLSRAFAPHVSNCILDGEMVGYDPETCRLVSKASHVDVKSLREDSALQPCFVAFDLLFLNGEVLTNRPLQERAALLDAALVEVSGRVMLSKRTRGSTAKEAAHLLNEAIERREEGIVLKSLLSVYKPNARRAGWLKLKAEYVDNLVSDLDLLILGGYFGEGRRSGDVSHFLLGVGADERAEDGTPTAFLSVAKVGSGYSQQELDQLRAKLTNKWKVYDVRRPPQSVVLAPGHKEKPDLYVDPQDSVVLQVKASELVRSANFHTGVTLRFPRVAAVRYDKPWHDAMSLSELRDLEKTGGGQLATGAVDLEDGGSPAKKPRLAAASVGVQFQPADLSGAVAKRDVITGREVCVVTGCGELTKQQLELVVAEHGGTIVQNPGETTFCVVADKVNFKTRNLSRKKLWDVIKAERFLRWLEEGAMRAWEPCDLWSCSEVTERRLELLYDCYGDSYTDPVTPESLKELFGNLPSKGDTREAAALAVRFERENFHHAPGWALFRGRHFLFEGSGDSRLGKLTVELYGGKLLGSKDDVDGQDSVGGTTSVDVGWIERCVRAGRIVSYV